MIQQGAQLVAEYREHWTNFRDIDRTSLTRLGHEAFRRRERH